MAKTALRVAVPDLVSNSYFPAVAATKLGCFEKEGFEANIELIFPVDKAYEALRDGQVDFVAGSAHSAVAAFPEWKGVKLLCAQAQGMYWFLVMRSDIAGERGDLSVIRGRRIGAAPWVDMGLRALLDAAGIDVKAHQITIIPVPGAKVEPGRIINFGVTAAQALAEGSIDGFWANGMGAELAVRKGVGRIVLDVRRGDGPEEAFHYTFASLATTDEMIDRNPLAAEAAIGAIKTAHAILRRDVHEATKAVEGLYPPMETGLIADLIQRDLPYYEVGIDADTVRCMNKFARKIGILSSDPAYENVVATRFSHLW